MEFRILGSLEVVREGSVVQVGGPRHRKLLAVLVVHANETVTTERLIDLLWGEEPPRAARGALHVRVSELRRSLRNAGQTHDGARIETLGSGYRLAAREDAVDARRFERLIAAGRDALEGGDHEAAAGALDDALALWRGPPVPELADEAFVRPEAGRLAALHEQALEARVDVLLALGRPSDAIVELEPLVAAHPLRERHWQQLMLAQYCVGRQADALETYRTARQVLVDELGIEPGSELRRLHAAILDQDPGLDVRPRPATQPAEAPGNLPAQLTTFVGREDELADIRSALRGRRLVTLVGVGGVGKSRLAVETAARTLADHAGGTWLIELAALTQPGLVAGAVAAALGVREHPERPLADMLAEHLRTSDALLVLDNCERLVGEVAELAQRLLQACPSLSILATSRERLGITGEVLVPLAGLDVPPPAVTGTQDVERAEAAQLLADRAAAVCPGFRLDATTAPAVAEICRRLDGLPLAIELAAARANALEVQQIAGRLSDRFRLLSEGDRTASPRHQALRAVVDWSYALLSEPERTLFEHVSVFVGGFTVEAAEAVSGAWDHGGSAPSELLWRLVDKSLVLSEPTSSPRRRYRMLETLRAYGLERLEASSASARLRERHANYFLAFAEPAGEALRGPDQSAWLDRLELEHGNLRAALEWSLERGHADAAVRLAGSLYAFWDLHGHYREGRRWLAEALALEGPVTPASRSRALMGSATLAVIQGDLECSARDCDEAAALCRQTGDAAGLAHALQYLGLGAIFASELDRAAALLTASLTNARVAGDAWLEGWALAFLGATALADGSFDLAVALATECETVSHPAGDPECVAWALLVGAMGSWSRDDLERAVTLLRRALVAFRDLDAPWGLSLGLVVAALSAGSNGNLHRAAALMGASERMRKSIGAALMPFVEQSVSAATAEGRSALGDDVFERAWRAGEALSPAAAVDEALRELAS